MVCQAKVIKGYGVASGMNSDPRYPKGTLDLQIEHFLNKGLDLSEYFSGTLNVDISPFEYKIREAKYFLKNIKWTDFVDAENFYFFDVTAIFKGTPFRGLIYLPDPSTKKEHFQSKSTLELILPKITEIYYGDKVILETNDNQIELIRNA